MKKQLVNISLLICVSICSGFAIPLYSQQLSFFNDYLDNVQVFDNGSIKQVEHLPLKNYQVTNNAIAYEDNSGNFKVYHNHYLHSLSNFVSNYHASDNLVGFNMNTQLKVFDNGSAKNLSINMRDYFVDDELIVWYDDFEKRLKVYYEKETYDLDDALATDTMNSVMLGENTVAFVDSKNYMNIFYEKFKA